MPIDKVIILLVCIDIVPTLSQMGPDPWHDTKSVPHNLENEDSIPPDIRMPMKRKNPTEIKLGAGEWFFKRTLAVMLKSGQTKINEDGTVDISLQMKYNPQQWNTLQDYIQSEVPLTEDMYRRALGYFETSIYKPSITERIVLAWSEYVLFYLSEYKIYLTWGFSILSLCLGILWMWNHLSHRHVVIIVFIIFYLYEVFISYKEVEKKEMEIFLKAVDSCKWYFWTSTCEAPRPDPLIFLNHMNPLKIGIRMFTTALAEPFIVIISMLKTILHGVTDGLWWPLDSITYAILITITSVSLIYFFIMIIFNWLLNIPFKCGIFGFKFSIQQRNRTVFAQEPPSATSDGISQATLDKILNVCSLALTNNVNNAPSSSKAITMKPNHTPIRRSASTGRLPKEKYTFENYQLEYGSYKQTENNPVIFRIGTKNGGGDAH